MRGVRQLPEICRSCGREIRTLERCVVLSTREEKRVGDVTFRESVTEGVCCLECASEGQAIVAAPKHLTLGQVTNGGPEPPARVPRPFNKRRRNVV